MEDTFEYDGQNGTYGPWTWNFATEEWELVTTAATSPPDSPAQTRLGGEAG